MLFRTSKINKIAGLPRGTKWSGGFTQSLENGFVPTKVGTVRPKPFFSAGFTLIEMMTVIVIATIIITALVVQQNRWNDRLTVSTQAYELALMIRQAQIYSLGVREDTGGSGDKFDVGYGVFVDAGTPTQYIFFVDRDKDLRYDVGEGLETKILTRGVTITKVCSEGIFTGIEWCSNNFLGSWLVYRYHGTFKRPDTSTKITFFNINSDNTTSLLQSKANIYLISPGGRQSVVAIDSTGQVSVDDL